jgi:hypothetical protein
MLIRQLWVWSLPLLVFVAGIGFIAVPVLVWRRRNRRQVRLSPLTRELLRAPGHSLRLAVEDAYYEFMTLTASMSLMPILMFSFHLSQSYFGGMPETVFRGVCSLLVTVLFLAVLGVLLVRLLERRKRLVLGLEGELATGEELNQLMLDGCRVFHDIETRWGNIDHVVVSHSGLFTVETKLLGKLQSGEGRGEAVVDHENNIVRFPDRTYRIPVEQLETQAKWLSQFLSEAVGERVEAEPILALPGWFIKERVGRGRVFVINPLRPKRFFVHERRVFSEAQVQRIAHQLEQLCRNVEPSFRQQPRFALGKTPTSPPVPTNNR